VSLKGLCGIQIDVHGAQTDLHSGIYGGALQNPIEALAHILASLRAEDGTILVEGFFDDVAPLTEGDRTDIAAVPFNEAQVKERLGVSGFFGEPGYTPAERMGARPTLEINGIWGGFQGEGVKTVIPKEAHAKITCRLVAHQNPEKIIEALVRHVEAHTPPGVSVTVTPLPATADPYLLPSEHWATDAAAEVLTDVYQVQPIRTRTGQRTGHRHLPAVPRRLHHYLCLWPERRAISRARRVFRLSSFERGQRAYCRLLARLGR
jgi:acetylornithine deacetylase/succinyl-diaminopimelate desuccinylase-like protein